MDKTNQNILEAVHKLRGAINNTEGVDGHVSIFYSYDIENRDKRMFGKSSDDEVSLWENHGIILQHLKDLTEPDD